MRTALARLRERPDFQRNPGLAIWRRLYWRWRWLRTSEPWTIRLTEDLVVLVPRSGSSALIYYQGQSEPETAQFILRFLKPGMIFVDVGAHVGEYTLLASRAVGNEGQVHAFEPTHELFTLLTRTVIRNNTMNIVLNQCALANRNGTADFIVREELTNSSLGQSRASRWEKVIRTETVPVQSLDRYCEQRALTPHLIKIDVEGAELLVLDGARNLLKLTGRRAPVWVIEYSQENYARFDVSANALFTRFEAAGWHLYSLGSDGEPQRFARFGSNPPGNLVAFREPLAR